MKPINKLKIAPIHLGGGIRLYRTSLHIILELLNLTGVKFLTLSLFGADVYLSIESYQTSAGSHCTPSSYIIFLRLKLRTHLLVSIKNYIQNTRT